MRLLLEMCAPLWAGQLYIRTGKALSDSLERVQKNFCKLLYPNLDYITALQKVQIQRVSDRRLKLTKNFGIKMAKNPKFEHLFPKIAETNTRSKRVFLEPKWQSNRMGYSFFPFAIRLMNEEIKLP